MATMEIQRPCNFEVFLAELSAWFINADPEEIDVGIEDAQRTICGALGLDQCTLWQWDSDEPNQLYLTHLHRPPELPPAPETMDAHVYFPWTLKRALSGECMVLNSLEDLPPEAQTDYASYQHFGTRSTFHVPLITGGNIPFAVVTFTCTARERAWNGEDARRLKLVAQIFANALARKHADQELRKSEARLELAMGAAGAGAWNLDLESKTFWLTQRSRDIHGFSDDETIGWQQLMEVTHPDDRQGMLKVLEQIVEQQREGEAEYRVILPDGRIRWLASRGRLQCGVPGEKSCLVMGVTTDVTARKDAEQRLTDALAENQELNNRLQEENVSLRHQLERDDDQDAIIGESQAIVQMLEKAWQVAPMDATVLIAGETGTGKELLAQAIHEMSPRKAQPMVKVNCAALPAPLIEGELFGREKGAYTGALTQQVGRFEVADGSTIFLDEIGDLPLELQVKLLRVLQDGRFERLGSHKTLQVDVRVVAATNRDLEEMVRKGTFREDLFHRLNVFPIESPPLRNRIEDLPLLVWSFVQELNAKMGRFVDSIPKQTMKQLAQYRWPGNIRELRNVIERAMILNTGHSLKIDLPEAGQTLAHRPTSLEEVERAHIENILEQTHWRVSGKGGAADLLGLVPTTLHSRLKKLGILRPTP